LRLRPVHRQRFRVGFHWAAAEARQLGPHLAISKPRKQMTRLPLRSDRAAAQSAERLPAVFQRSPKKRRSPSRREGEPPAAPLLEERSPRWFCEHFSNRAQVLSARPPPTVRPREQQLAALAQDSPPAGLAQSSCSPNSRPPL